MPARRLAAPPNRPPQPTSGAGAAALIRGNRMRRSRLSGKTLAVMMNTTIFLIVSLLGVQAIDTGPKRFGSVGRDLSVAEIVQITDLAKSAGKRPWLVVGFPSMITGVATLTVYLEPDATEAPVRRGRMLRLIADDPPVVPQRSAWTVKTTGSYAYVDVPGRRPTEIVDERDVRWPFAVEGEIDDATLISMVGFIRAKPSLPGVPEGQASRVVAEAPISAVARRNDQFVVALRTSEATGQRVTLARKNGQWAITHFEQWIV
jgi:hypothetical protein